MTRLDDLVAVLRASADPDAIADARKHLDREADDAWLPRLRALLSDDDVDVREAAAAPVARLDGAASLPGLLAAFHRGEDEEHDDDRIGAIVVGLVESKPKAAEPVLRAWLTDADARVRRAAARLWGCADLPVAPLAAAGRDVSPPVRAAAAGSLAAFAPDRAALDAVVALTSDPDVSVRVAAASALSVFPGPVAQRRLADLARDPDERVRAVATCLGWPQR